MVEGLSPEGAVCLLLDSGAYGMLRVEDAERLQVRNILSWIYSVRMLPLALQLHVQPLSGCRLAYT